jgi:hypothetical protein
LQYKLFKIFLAEIEKIVIRRTELWKTDMLGSHLFWFSSVSGFGVVLLWFWSGSGSGLVLVWLSSGFRLVLNWF